MSTDFKYVQGLAHILVALPYNCDLGSSIPVEVVWSSMVEQGRLPLVQVSPPLLQMIVLRLGLYEAHPHGLLPKFLPTIGMLDVRFPRLHNVF